MPDGRRPGVTRTALAFVLAGLLGCGPGGLPTAVEEAADLPVLRLVNSEVSVELDLRFGGAITALAPADGENLVNAHDPGRLIQPTVYDGRFHYPHQDPMAMVWPWNPVPGGDRLGVTSGVLNWLESPDRIMVQSRPRQWNGSGPADVLLTVEVSLDGPAVRYEWRFENLSMEWREAYGIQELPAVYVVRALDRVVGYVGDAPWTGAPPTALPLREADHVFTEAWGALVDEMDRGITVWSPRGDARFRTFVTGQTRSRSPLAPETAYITVFGFGDLPPGAPRGGEAYIIPGDWREARVWIEGRAAPLPRAWRFEDSSTPRWSFSGFGGESEPNVEGGFWRLTWHGRPATAVPAPVGWSVQPGDSLFLEAEFDGDPVPVWIRYWKHDGVAWFDGCEAEVHPEFDGVVRTYPAALWGAACYRDGWVRQLALVLEAGPGVQGTLKLAGLRLNR